MACTPAEASMNLRDIVISTALSCMPVYAHDIAAHNIRAEERVDESIKAQADSQLLIGNATQAYMLYCRAYSTVPPSINEAVADAHLEHYVWASAWSDEMEWVAARYRDAFGANIPEEKSASMAAVLVRAADWTQYDGTTGTAEPNFSVQEKLRVLNMPALSCNWENAVVAQYVEREFMKETNPAAVHNRLSQRGFPDSIAQVLDSYAKLRAPMDWVLRSLEGNVPEMWVKSNAKAVIEDLLRSEDYDLLTATARMTGEPLPVDTLERYCKLQLNRNNPAAAVRVMADIKCAEPRHCFPTAFDRAVRSWMKNTSVPAAVVLQGHDLVGYPIKDIPQLAKELRGRASLELGLCDLEKTAKLAREDWSKNSSQYFSVPMDDSLQSIILARVQPHYENIAAIAAYLDDQDTYAKELFRRAEGQPSFFVHIADAYSRAGNAYGCGRFGYLLSEAGYFEAARHAFVNAGWQMQVDHMDRMIEHWRSTK
ncbi:hypothetical protein HY642_04515 [Candidatus Woesearchaeota archaeon]|nr:hypothetical protein [Candidatus Woesearchaeota archaeon]